MNKFKNLIALFGFAAVMFTGCMQDDVDEFHKPIIDEDFTVTVVENNVSLVCNMTPSLSVLWELSTGDQSTNQETTIKVWLKGDYSVVLSVSIGGDYVASDTVTFTIEESDLTFLNNGIWKDLTGGEAGYNKTWKLDLVEYITTTIDNAGVDSVITTYKSQYFHNVLDFYGTNSNGGWGPWVQPSIYGWDGLPEQGTITFDGSLNKVKLILNDGVFADGTAVKNADGTDYEYGENATSRIGTFEGDFSMSTKDRVANFFTIASANNGNEADISLWDYMLTKTGYQCLGELSSEVGYINFSEGLRFPLDKGRVGEQQFTTNDLESVMIMHCSDSALIVSVRRSFNGFNESGDQKPDVAWVLYNYVVDSYKYDDVTSYTHPVKSDGTIEAGTYKLADVPGNWIDWSTKEIMNDSLTDGDAFKATMYSWLSVGDPATSEDTINIELAMGAIKNVSLTFSANGNCTIHNESFADSVVTASDITTTYAIGNGYVSFGEPISIYAAAFSIVDALNVYIVDVANTDGLWIGINNEDKEETIAVELVKQ